MHTRISAFIVFFLLICAPYSFAAIICPPMPTAVTQVNRDVRSDITASVASLGRVKAGEVSTKTEVTAKNLFEKYPNVDKLLALQTMAATYCAMLRDTKTLNDKEKLNRWERFQEKVLNLQSAPTPEKRPQGKRNSLAAALRKNRYEFGWSGDPVGTTDRRIEYYIIESVVFDSDTFVILKYSRPGGGEVRATLHDQKLTGTWRDVDGTGELELLFDDSIARAVGWWNYGGQMQKYNIFMRRVK
jgi:hypothetical protein